MNIVRRAASRLLVVLLALSLFAPLVPARDAVAANSLAEQLGLDPAFIPPDMGQTSLDVFVPETKHSIRGMMLDYWRANGAVSVYGYPISEPYAAPNGLYSQAFERGIFQFRPELQWSDDPMIRLMPIGSQAVTEKRSATRADGRRTGADRRASAWRPGSESEARQAEVANSGGRFSQTTGFSIADAFGDWYNSHEGWFYLGAPISEPHRGRGVQVQYFESGILMETGDRILVAPMPREQPRAYGIDTRPVEQAGRPEFSEALFIQNPNPYGIDPSAYSGRKRIFISISDQTMTVYQGSQMILQTYVSTGLPPNDTEVGDWHIRLKFEKQDMAGFADDTGEVVGLRGGSGNQEGIPWEVKDVPHVMYFNFQAEALHGAYWHNNFGSRMSHGCVNQPLDVAAFMYDFAPLGTEVTVTE